MTILIVDYGMGNIASARRSFEECGATVSVSNDPSAIERADHVVLPGVGAFSEAMARLQSGGWVPALQAAALLGRPILGICLGMQLLAEEGDEGGRTPGLGLIRGKIMRLAPVLAEERVPHVGWNDINLCQRNRLFDQVPDRSDFYFVHSYHFNATNAEDVIATTDYCGGLVSAVARQNIFGVQFHPEKSSRVGLRLLKNFMAL